MEALLVQICVSSTKLTARLTFKALITGLDVVTAATLLNTSQGKVIGIFNEYAYLGKGSLTEFRQPVQVQSHLEMPGILVQLGHIQRT